MSPGETAYFAMVLTAFAIFACVVSFIATWSGRAQAATPSADRKVDMWDTAPLHGAAKTANVCPFSTSRAA